MAKAVTWHVGAFTRPVNSSATIVEGDLVGENSSGEAIEATSAAAGPLPAIGVATADQANGYVAIAPIAIVEEAGSSLAEGTTVWLGTAGAGTQTKPTTTNDVLQAVGLALTTTKVIFNCAAPVLKVQAAATTTVASL